MTAWEFLRSLHEVCHFHSRERPGREASMSELKRWCSSLRINTEQVSWNEDISDIVFFSVTLFKNEQRITLM